MSGFTTEELEAVGLRRGVNWGFAILSAQDRNGFYRSIGGSWPELADCWLWMAPQSSRDGAADAVAVALVRLAFAHPERAALALGKGWKVEPPSQRGKWPWGPMARWSISGGDMVHVSIFAYHSGNVEAVVDRWCPPEFDANLARARRISAALKAIAEEKQ